MRKKKMIQKKINKKYHQSVEDHLVFRGQSSSSGPFPSMRWRYEPLCLLCSND